MTDHSDLPDVTDDPVREEAYRNFWRTLLGVPRVEHGDGRTTDDRA